MRLELRLICPGGTHFIFSAKHFINNEQEHFREVGSSNVDDRYVARVPSPIPLISDLADPELSMKSMLHHSSKVSSQVLHLSCVLTVRQSLTLQFLFNQAVIP